MNHLKLIFIILIAAGNYCYSDQVFLKNGDQLSGKIVKLVEEKMIFKTELVGEVEINIEDIQTLSSIEPIEMHIKDGTVLTYKVTPAEEGRIELTDDQEIIQPKVNLADITAINPYEGQSRWKGSISGGLTRMTGNTSNESYSTSVNIQKRGKDDRTFLGTDYAFSEQKDTNTGQKDKNEDWLKVRGRYDYFLTKKFFLFGEGRYEKDSIALLDRRVIMGGGAGYQWIESKAVNFSTEAGLASLYEKYGNEADSNTGLSAQAGYHFDKQIFKSLSFIHDMIYYPSTEDVADYYLTTSAEIRANLTKNIFTNIKMIMDYDQTPAPGKSSTDTKYMLGVGWEF